jgi:tetratricopeptide (TPR) repeat protein
MRVLLAFVLLSALPVYPQSKVLEAYALWRSGQPEAAVSLLKPLVEANPRTLQDTELGVAWGLLATSYQALEKYDPARRAYQNAMEILGSIEAARKEYAAILDNLATMNESLGQMDVARRLSEKALALYQELGDSSGVAITYTDLAVLGLAQNQVRDAQRALENAFAAEKAGGIMDDDDVAAMNAVKATLALRAGHAEEAETAASVSIDCWIRQHGQDYYLLGTSYMVRARARIKLGEYAQALTDAQRAVALAETAIGKNSRADLSARGVLAEVLKASGNKEGARMEKEVRQEMAALQARQCYQCTIDASGFRQAERGSYGLPAGIYPRH